jgi:PAS domain S-box-containing protein
MFDLPNQGYNATRKPIQRDQATGRAVVIDISRYVFETLREDEEFVLDRGQTDGDLSAILVVAPVSEHPVPGILERLEHEYALRDELDSAWAARPLTLAHREDRTMLILEDPGGEPLDRLLGQPMELTRFLRFAVGLAAALGQLHQQGLVHKDIKPANILVNSVTGAVWFTGFGIASLLPRERQSPEPPEIIAGTLAYMAPEQTGRMNRSIDSRSDLYSLGVTFYEMLTGVLPFTASDPMEWVHCHIARQPVPPSERWKDVPATVSAITLKLLSKTAEERYQTAAGVEADLRRCLAEWEALRRIGAFPLGVHDMSDRLLMPEKLYGRNRESKTLLDAFDQVVSTGRPNLVLVSGYSGIGKSSVVNELHKVLVQSRGLFASGKFDQYKRDIPYSTLAQAFQSLVRALLAESEAELGRWRDALSKVLGPSGQLIVNLVPELELVIGKQPPVADLPPQDAQNRFQMVFRRFLGVFARPEHPLALFLDDLQWLDKATLDLLQHLITEPEVGPLLLVGAYRDNEVSPSHPLMRTLDAMHNAGASMQEIVLAPLAVDDVSQLVADTLHCERDSSQPLAELVHEKTGGNPFFAIQFLTALVEEGLLAFDPFVPAWQWDINHIRAKNYTDNVVDLMAGKLKRFSATTQEALKQLACLGNIAEIATLTLVHGETEEAVHVALWEAVHAGLVFRQDSAYKFLHDRIQQAAYTLIPEEHRTEVHLRIGRVLRSRMPAEEIAKNIFSVVNQFNAGKAHIRRQTEKEQVAELNLTAGQKAKTSAAYASACTYLSAGMALIGQTGWKRCYGLALNLWLERAECEFLAGNFETAEQLISEVLRNGRSKLEKSAAYTLKLQLCVMKTQNPEAVGIALECLGLFGIEMPPHPTREQVQTEYEEVWKNLEGRSIGGLTELPRMRDPEMHAAMNVLSALFVPALSTDSNLLRLLFCRMVNVSLKYGTTDASPYGYAWFGLLLGPVFHRYKEAYEFGKLALDLIERHSFLAWKAKLFYVMEMVLLWTHPLKTAIEHIRAAFRTGVEVGDLTYACYGSEHTVTDLLLQGEHLDQVWREAIKARDFALRAKYQDVADVLLSIQRFVQRMRGRTASFSTFDLMDEQAFEAQLTENRYPTKICWYWILNLRMRFMTGDHAAAIAAAQKAKVLLWASECHIQLLDYCYYAALASAAYYQQVAPDGQLELLELLTGHLAQLKEWAENCPSTFQDKYVLVAAEFARLEGRDLDAMRLYEEAIRSAHENGFVQNEGLANELAAQFYLKRGIEKVAQTYLREARYCYLRWGALGKVNQLDQRYPGLAEPPSVGPTTTIGAPVEHLELETVMKASQAVSGEIVLERLIETLVVIVIEHAGAERGLLILRHGEELRIAAEARTGRDGVEVELQDALVTTSDLPDSLLHYVIRTQKSMILDDASTQNLFSEDEYVRQRRPRSVLCLPLVKQVKLVGILYLENSLAPRVFTPKRLAMLEMLSSQAAISLDHARLYADLGRLNAELRRSEAYLAEGEKISHTASWAWNVATGEAYWSQEHFRIFGFDPEKAMPSYRMFLQRIHPEDRRRAEQTIERAVRERSDFEQEYRVVLPDGSIKYVHTVGHPVVNESGVFQFIGTAMDVTEVKRAEEMRAAMARERELFAQQRATELAKANEALRGCLDALASVPELDDFLGQVMAVITRHLGAVASTLRVLNLKQNTLPLELVFQDGRVMSPDEAKYPESWRSLSLDEQHAATFLDQPTAVARTLDPQTPIPEALRLYLLGLGIKTLLIIPLTLGGQAKGQLSFRFTEERDFDPEELEIARALAIQASLAIHLTQLAKSARQSAILEERNQLAAEIHDALAQSFTGISMQLGVAGEQLAAREGDPLRQIQRANEIAKYGLAEARRSILSLRSSAIEESGLTTTLQRLVEHSNVAGRLRCDFRSDHLPEESFPPRIRHELLRFAQEAISNAVRHARPTVVSVTLRWERPNLILQVKDNGSGISSTSLAKSEGFGLRNMRTRASQIDGKLDIQTVAGHGTSIVLTVPIPS